MRAAKQSLFIILLALTQSSFANTWIDWWQKMEWRPILTLGGGSAFATDVGQSQNFPIVDPATDEFYNYAASSNTQTATFYQGFIGAERPLCSNGLIQLGLEYNQVAPFTAKGILTQGVDVPSENSYNYSYNVIPRQLLVETKLLYTLQQIVHPYFLVGLGISLNKAYSYGTDAPPLLTFTRMYANHSNTAFSYALGLGVDADVCPHVRVGAGYRFSDYGPVKLGNATIDTSNVAGTLTQSHLYINEILAEISLIA